MQARLVQSACYLNCQVAPAIPTPASKPALDIFRLLYMPCRLIPGHSIWRDCPHANNAQIQAPEKSVASPTTSAIPHFKMEELIERYGAKLFLASNERKIAVVSMRMPKIEIEMIRKIAQETHLDVTAVNMIAFRLLDEVTTEGDMQRPALRISDDQLSGLLGKLMLGLYHQERTTTMLTFRISPSEVQLLEMIMDRLDLNRTKTVRLALRLIVEIVNRGENIGFRGVIPFEDWELNGPLTRSMPVSTHHY